MAQANASEAQRLTAEASARNVLLEAQLAELAAKNTERGLVITLGDVLFGLDLARLNADGMRMAQRLATFLQQNPKRTVLLGVAEWGGVSALNKLVIPSDTHLILTIHYYNPFTFTHQGAEWVSGSAKIGPRSLHSGGSPMAEATAPT